MSYRFIIALVAFHLIGFLGRSQETLQNIDSVLTVLQKTPEDTSKAILYQKIGGHYNVTNLDSAQAFFRKGVTLSKALRYKKGEWMNLNGIGNFHERKTQYDSAMYYYNKALTLVEETQSTKGFAIVLNNIATIHIRQGNYKKALGYLFDALTAEEKLKNPNGIAQAYNNIGVVYYYIQDFDKTTFYLTEALKTQEQLGNFDGLINGYNNVGAIYDYQKKYDEAITSYSKGLEIAKKIKDKKMQATQLSNIALAYSNKKEFSTAERIFNEAVALRQEIKDYNGEAFSYQAFGQMYLEKKNYSKAKLYFDKGIEIADLRGLKIVKKEILEALVTYAEAQSDYKSANEYLKQFLIIKDSLLNEESAKAIAEIETKYETEKKEKEIVAQRAQLAEKDLEVRRKNTWIYGGFGLAIVLGLLGYLVYNQQKLKNHQLQKESELKEALARIETQNKLQEQRLRISRDLHDNIGSQLTFIISSLDNLKYGFPDMKETLGDKLSGISSFTSQTIYELRDTIWAMNKSEISFEDLQSRITNFINQAQAASSRVLFSFNIDKEHDEVSYLTSIQGMNIYRIIQEAVNNALKYANASQIKIHVASQKNEITIEIQDNGKGFSEDKIIPGNGLMNMKKRASDLGGKVNILSSINNGTTVKLVLPII
ncbi:MAG: tetratricopeptide repeat protein [Flavobacteriaceae bacterium]